MQSYDANRAVVDQGLNSLPKSLRAALKSARTPDGRLLSSMPELVSLMHTIGRNSTPTHDAADDLKVEEEARRWMRNDTQTYYRDGWDKKLTAILHRRGVR